MFILKLPRKLSDEVLPLVGGSLKVMESLGARYRSLGRVYYSLFYRSIVEREMEFAEIKPGSKVLNVGCGPLPMTAVSLARNGHSVVALDKDKKAVESARKVVDDLGLDLEIVRGDPGCVDITEFDAVWVSLHVSPRSEVVEMARALKEDQVLVFRNVRGWLSEIYPRVSLGVFGRDVMRVKRSFGKESVFVNGGEA